MARRRYRYRGRSFGRKLNEKVIVFLVGLIVFGAMLSRLSQDTAHTISVMVKFVLAVLCILGVVYVLIRYSKHIVRAVERHKRFKPYDTADIRQLISMDPFEFEKYVGYIFEQLGYSVRVTQGSGDEGIDIHMKKDGKKYVVQVKKYGINHPVPAKEVRDFYGSYAGLGVSRGLFVTTSDFTGPSRDWASTRSDLELINGKKLLAMRPEMRELPWYKLLLSNALGAPVETMDELKPQKKYQYDRPEERPQRHVAPQIPQKPHQIPTDADPSYKKFWKDL